MKLAKEQNEQHLCNIFRQGQTINARLRIKRQMALLNLPLFKTIYQKKGSINFHPIVQKISLKSYGLGISIIDKQEFRSFNYVINGTVAVYTLRVDDPIATPILYKKYTKNEYFGEQLNFSPNEVFYSAQSVCTTTMVLQLDLHTFYKVFLEHFQYPQLKEKVSLLENICTFKHIKRRNLQRILLLSRLQRCRRNKILFQQKEIPQKIFVIIEGEITLFKKENQINRPFCILSKGEVCGLEDINNRQYYTYGSVCTQENSLFLEIDKKTVLQFILSNINQHQIQCKLLINQQLLNQQTIIKKNIQTSKHQNETILQEEPTTQGSRYYKTDQNLEKMKFSITRENQLKHPVYRQYKLNEIRRSLRAKMSQTSLSEYSNRSFSQDKNMLFKYLVDKQVKTKIASDSQARLKSLIIPLLRGIKVQKSPAVKNQKRKMKCSRKNAQSLISLY